MLPENVLRVLLALFSTLPEVEQVFLYGSRARGTHSAYSDIDLAVSAPRLNPAGFARLQYAVSFELPTLIPAEIARLDGAAADFQERILSRGVLLYDRNHAFQGR